MLTHQYRVVINRYSRLLFTSEDRLCTNLRVQEQSTNMTSQHNANASRSRGVTDQLWWRHNVQSEMTVLSDNGEMSERCLFLAEWC